MINNKPLSFSVGIREIIWALQQRRTTTHANAFLLLCGTTRQERGGETANNALLSK